jgi:hypothetical protein
MPRPADSSLLLTPPRCWSGPMRAFAPADARTLAAVIATQTVATSVQITSVLPAEITLMLAFDASATPAGVGRVAAFQPVAQAVRIDLGSQASLYWMATVLEAGALSPNQASYAYSQPDESFRMQLTPQLTLTHDANGWQIPPYDSSRYSVSVGFGLNVRSWVYWGFSIACTPNQANLRVEPRGYVLVQSSGSEQIGDPIDPALAHWTMPLGHAYALQFAANGTGTLTVLG